MVLLSSHFLEILLKILFWWTALHTQKCTLTSKVGYEKTLEEWSDKASHVALTFLLGLLQQKGIWWDLGVLLGMCVLPDLHPPGSRAVLGTALSGVCHLCWSVTWRGGGWEGGFPLTWRPCQTLYVALILWEGSWFPGGGEGETPNKEPSVSLSGESLTPLLALVLPHLTVGMAKRCWHDQA